MQVSQRVICLSGATGKQLYEVCATPGDRLGYSVAACGDWNDDGVPDFVAGAPRHVLAYGSISAGPGYALVCSGNNGAVLRRLEPESESVGFGYSIASLTGKTAAGPQPILVTAFGDIGEGALYSHSPDDRWPRRGCARGPLTDFGSLVCTIGDQDGDGVEDCAVSSSPWNPDASWDGSVTLISCKDGKELCVLRRPAD